MKISLLGVPWDLGNVVARGSCEGPSHIRVHLPPTMFADIGDVDRIHGENAQSFFARVSAVLPDGPTFVIGGDHSISFTAVERAQRSAPLSVIWIDAHTDFSNFDGHSWHDHKQVLRRIAGLPNVDRIILYGHRGMTPGDERRTDPKLTVMSAAGPVPDFVRLLDPGSRCYLSIDIDAIDPRYAPGTATPVPGGLSVDGLVDALRPMLQHCITVGIDLVEFSPSHDFRGVTAKLAAALVERLAVIWQASLSAQDFELRQFALESSS